MFETAGTVDKERDRLLQELETLASGHLVAALDRTLGKVDDYLFDRSEVGHEAVESITALRSLRRERASLLQRFAHEIGSVFKQLPIQEQGSPKYGELSLMDDEKLEEQLANNQLADTLKRRHHTAIDALNQRIASLLQVSTLSAGRNPLEPEAIAQAANATLRDVAVNSTQRIVLYKYLERELVASLSDLYTRCNALLNASGITGVVAPPLQAAAQSPARPVLAPEATTRVDTASQGLSADDSLMFAKLVDLLQSWRGGSMAVRPQDPPGTGDAVLETGELVSVLSDMQRQPTHAWAEAANDGRQPLAQHMRREVFDSARQRGIEGDRLNALDEDAVDMVALLFDTFLEDWNFEPRARGLIGRLMVPLMKVAVRERDMFMQKHHPARRFLNTIAEACDGNSGEGPLERELLKYVSGMIDRLVVEFNEDVAIFETLDVELQEYLRQYRRRVEVVEKRTAEAQHGRERLHLAREAVTEALALPEKAGDLPEALQQFVGQYGVHHLTMLHLREGQDSDRYRSGLETIRMLLDRMRQGMASMALDDAERRVVMETFASSGLAGAEAEQALRLLLETIARHRGNRIDSGVRDASEPPQRLPEQPANAAVAGQADTLPFLEVVGGDASLDYDDDVFARMQSLQIGDWITLHDSAGKPYPAKATWISPISARLLFVNRRGIRVLVASRHELAAMAKLGTMAFRDSAPAFDVAMRRVVERMSEQMHAGNAGTHG